jgi:protein-disulfide isomerase
MLSAYGPTPRHLIVRRDGGRRADPGPVHAFRLAGVDVLPPHQERPSHAPAVRLLVQRLDRVRFIVRDFPVQELHPDAVTAAEAAGCAEVQGKFWPMHDRLFGLKGQMSRPDLDRAAEASGLDMPLYAACMDLHARIDEIQADAAAGVAAGVRGTPTFFFNGQPVEGAIPREAFDALIQRFLAQP